MTDQANDLVLTRILEAPSEQLWRCWTDAELLKRWFMPKPWTTVFAEVDPRPGGIFHTIMRSPEGEDMPNEPGVFLEAVPNERLIFTDAFKPGWKPSGAPFMTVEIKFADAGNVKTLYRAQAMHWSAEAKNKHEEMGFYDGWGKAADQLEELARTL